ncbi:MAG: sigma-E factor negative regulatory protein [Piscinibacter sp.]|nr:sigma-E factor negative regulatory protein [Piscinibacter sp.]
MEQQMSGEREIGPMAAERLSALMDGELHEAADVAQSCRAWREDAAVRASWHCYHLIGDVMRSEDLAGQGARDAAFLRGLRSRLEAEPVVLAPAARSTPRPRRWRWAGPAAVAAGFVAVAGVLVVTRSPLPEGSPEVAQAPKPAPAAPAVVPVATATATATSAAEPVAPVADGKLIRDARLDRYLAAHQQFAGTTALGPSTFLRRATTDAAANR